MVASSESTDPKCAAQTDGKGPSLSRLVNDLRASAAEFGEYAKYLVALELDNARLMAKKAAFFAAIGAVGLVVLMGVLAVAAALLLIGIAGLVGMIFDNFWIGATIVGLLILGVIGAGAFFAWRYLNNSAYKSLRLKYAERRQRQEKMFGRDIKEVANV